MTANELTKQIINYCTKRGHFVFRVNNIPGTKYRKGNVKKGIADIQGCTKSGLSLNIEVKTTDKQSEDQREVQRQIEKRGGIYILAHSLEDVTKRGV